MAPTTVPHDRRVRPGALLPPLGLWVLLAGIAVANGVFREAVIIPRVGEYNGHVLSTALLVAAILLVSSLYFRNTTRSYTRQELVVVGVLWVALTVGFEFLVGYLEGASVEATLAQYDVFAGQVWIIVPLTLLVAPVLFGSVLDGDSSE